MAAPGIWQRGFWQRVGDAFPRAAACTVRELAMTTGVSIGLTLAWLAVIPVIDASRSGGDTKWYLLMAQNPKAVSWSPAAFRGLEPWLAYAIGGPNHNQLAFRLLTWAALAAAGPAAYLICRRLGGAHGAGLLGMTGLLCLPMWLFFIHQPYLVDGPAMALLAWSMVALVNGWFLLLPLLLTLTGLARETVVGFMVPIYMWIRTRWVDLHAAWQVVFWMAPAAVTVWAIRQPMEHIGYGSMGGLMKAGVNYVWRDVFHKHNPLWWVFYGIAGSLGIWWLFGIYGRRHGGRLWWMLVPVFAQWLFGSDYARYSLYAFPVVIAAGAIAVWQHPRRPVLVGLIVVQSLAFFADLWRIGLSGGLHVDRGRPMIYVLQPSTWISAGLMVLTAVVLWWPTRARPSTVDAPAAAPVLVSRE